MTTAELNKLTKAELVKLITDTMDIIEKRIDDVKADAETYPSSSMIYMGMQSGFEGALHIMNLVYENCK